jgi:signal transduction histidine kinase
MIVDLLRMVRIVSEPEPVESVDLGAVTAQAVEALQAHIAARGVQVDVAGPLPSVPGQATKLRHVVANLVGNAVRFVPSGTGVIGVSARREGRSVVLSVRDNGVGIPAEYHDAIFHLSVCASSGMPARRRQTSASMVSRSRRPRPRSWTLSRWP